MWSQSRDEPRDAVRIADELHALLAVASESPPYVMVGHSVGGLLVRVFDHRFPGEATGFVFVDSSHPDQIERLPPEIAEMGPPSPLLVKTLSAIGVFRLMSASDRPEALPEEAAAALVGFSPRSVLGALREVEALDTVLAQSAETGLLGSRPVVVLSAGRLQDPLPGGISQDTADRIQEVWRELQTELASLSTNSDHRPVPNASHYVHWDDPQAVIAAVRDVVNASRNGAAVRPDGD
jgi:pimeloyl-ACP methyl ester carboxylesterase